MVIKDKFNRPIKDLRISVIDRCNFRCPYCMPKEIYGERYQFLKNDQLLSFDEIKTISEIFSKFGVEKLRITGGEPLLRKNLPVLPVLIPCLIRFYRPLIFTKSIFRL